jgi:hypothetical protein
VPNAPSTSPGTGGGGGGGAQPVGDERFLFHLEADSKRLVRIDSATLEVDAYPTGLAPMDLSIVGGRSQAVLLDALDAVEVLDHRQEPPLVTRWETARSLSHLALSPSANHIIAYYDWDDSRAVDRQPDPGNINQVSVLALHGEPEDFSDNDSRLINIAVPFLPRDIRFSADGARAVVIAREALTTIELSLGEFVARPERTLTFDRDAAEIRITNDASFAVVRYSSGNRIDTIDLETGAKGCFLVSDTAKHLLPIGNEEMLVLGNNGEINSIGTISLPGPSGEDCASIEYSFDVGTATQLALSPAGRYVVASVPDIDVEEFWFLDLEAQSIHTIALEKAVSAVAFSPDDRFVLVSHLKKSGTPAWNPQVEDPEVSVDKSHGVSWVDLQERVHRLAISGEQFGPFSFVPGTDSRPSLTYQAVLENGEPNLIQVTHQQGFHDRWLPVAALPLSMGYLSQTDLVYVSQSHPWGRITFIDPESADLRHVTGFVLEAQ